MNVIKKFESQNKETIDLQYWLSLPSDYETSDKKYPLILFLHGAGERGTNPIFVKVHGLPKMIDLGIDVPAIVVSPQCPSAYVWDNITSTLKALIDEIMASYRVDESKVCCTGLSMGGFGTWMMGCTYPKLFSKLAPVCGGGMAWRAPSLKEIAIRAYHGGVDGVVSPDRSREMVEAVLRAGGNAELTIFEGVNHDSWVNAYEKSDMVQWLVS